jgi:hypothetical protein
MRILPLAWPRPRVSFAIIDIVSMGGDKNMKRLILACAIIASGPALGGCATVIHGVHQDVQFKSDPSSATIRVAQGGTCVTPCEIEMRRGNDSMVTYTLEGFEPASVYMQSQLTGAIAGNIIAGGIIGGIVDGSNGASNSLRPNPVYVRLVPVGSGREAELLGEDGQVVSTVSAHNASVATDVREGLERQGLAPAPR